MSHWLESATQPAQDIVTARARAIELRADAARFDVIRHFLERAFEAMPSAAECEGWVSRARTEFDGRLAQLASTTLKASHYAGIISQTSTNLAEDEEEKAVMLSAMVAVP